MPETSTTQWLKEHAPEGARIGYDPWLHTRDWVKKAKEALASRGAELVAVDAQPDRRNLERSARSVEGAPRRPVRPICRQVRGRKAHRDRRLACASITPTRRCSPRSIRSPGRSTSAAQDVTHTPVALAYALVHADGTADLFVASEKIGARGSAASRQRRPAARALRVRERAGGAQGQDGRGRSRARGRGDLRGARQGRREDPAAARPDDPAQGAKEPGRDRGPEGRPDARRRRHRPLPPLDRRGSAQGRSRRAHRVRQARRAAPREPRASRPVVRQHFRRRARTVRSSITSRARRPTASSRKARSI